MSYGPQHDTPLIEGYAVGFGEPESEWLCVYSSACSNRLIFPTPEAAQVRADWAAAMFDKVEVRKVRRESETYFRLLD